MLQPFIEIFLELIYLSSDLILSINYFLNDLALSFLTLSEVNSSLIPSYEIKRTICLLIIIFMFLMVQSYFRKECDCIESWSFILIEWSLIFPINHIYYHHCYNSNNMNNNIDSKLNRSLLIHNLDNLVFGKRERKSIQQVPLPTLNKHQHKSSQKKKDSSRSGSAEGSNRAKQSKLKKAKPLIKKEKKELAIKNEKKNGLKMKEQSEEEIIQQSIQSSPSDSVSAEILKKKQKKKSIKPQEKREGNHKDDQKEQIILKKRESHQKQQIKSTKHKIDLSGQNRSAQQPQINNTQEKPKKKRGRPKKFRNQAQSNFQSGKEQAKPEIEEPEDQKDPQIGQTILRIPAIQKKEVSKEPQEQIEAEAQDIAVVEPAFFEPDIEPDIEPQPEIVTGRTRRARLNPIKYNQNDEDANSQNSYEGGQFKKKKKIYKGKGKNSKPYNLNRIFRKQAKRNFPAFQIQVDLNQLSLESFVKQFGVFDLIHFSLPLKFLQLMTDAPMLMQKGFIFVWVEQGQTQIGYHLLNRWGYDVIDQIIWVKANQEEGKIQADDIDPSIMVTDSDTEQTKEKKLFVNMKSTCLVGYKCPLGNKAEYRTKVSNNIIFAKNPTGCKKPAQIYEIADLMMPGAKKLEVGGSSQKGWLNLNHQEHTLHRCGNCFKEENLYLLSQETKPVNCKKCIVNQLVSKAETEPARPYLNTKFRQISKAKIKQILFVHDCILQCTHCQKYQNQLEYQGLIRNTDSQCLCLQCYQLKVPNSTSQLDIIIKKKPYYHATQMKCSKCQQTTIYDTYFECLKSKTTRVCKQCFWRSSDQSVQPEKRINKNSINEWRLKFVKNNPLMKFNCFACKSDLSLPFWSCQTCQSWTWCGKCDKGHNEIHPHYQTDKHRQYLVI